MSTTDQQNSVPVTILEKTYKIKCPSERVTELRESAQYLDIKMREICQSTKITNTDQIAVIAALNIVHELLLQRKQSNTYIDAMSKRIQDLQSKIEAVLEE